VVGIDVGASRVDAVRLDAEHRLVDVAVFAASEVAAVVAWAAGARVAAIDGPDGPSVGAHAEDATLAPKFRRARTGEVALGRHHGLWVSWATPPELPPGGWMDVAAGLHRALEAEGIEALEVYPHGAFRELAAGGRLPSKRTAAGRAQRAALILAEIDRGDRLADGTHDALDAAAAALVAADRTAGVAVAAGPRAGDPPGDDGSRIWLPRRR
jgi:predicted nuclease with RNAse H fold